MASGCAGSRSCLIIFTFQEFYKSDLLIRTQKVSKSGIETGQAIQAASEQKLVSKADQLLKEFNNALLVKRETELQ